MKRLIRCAAWIAAGVLSVASARADIQVMASREYVDRKVAPKRDKGDYKVYRAKKDLWTWSAHPPQDSAEAQTPQDFLDGMNAANAPVPYYYVNEWLGVVLYRSDGTRQYAQAYMGSGQQGEASTNLVFTVDAYSEDGTAIVSRFRARATRASATDETLVEHDWARLVTTDVLPQKTTAEGGTARYLPKYLWLYETDDPYLDDAKAWYTNYDHVVSGGCSAIRKGDWLGRNFDFPYDERAEFVVKVPAADNRHASVGVSNLGTNLTEQFVMSGSPSPLYKVLPGVLVDGINDAGVVAEINVIPRDPTKDPVQGGDRQLSAFAVVRYVLDNFTSAAAAAADVAARYYIPAGSPNAYHWMIADKNGTYIVEDGTAVLQTPAAGGSALVNHRVLVDGAYDPDGGYAADPYGSGSGRSAALLGAASVQEALVATRYTHAYATGWPWPDEFAGQEDAQGLIPHDKVARLLAWANDKIAPKLDPTTRRPKARGNGCWQTVHSAIYDLTNKTLRVAVQETDNWFVFHLPASGAVKSVNGKIGEVELDAADVGALPANPDWYDIYADEDWFGFDAWTEDGSAVGIYAGGDDSCIGLYNGTANTGVELHADRLTVSTPNDSFDLKYPDEGGTLTTEEKIEPIVSNTNIVFSIDGSVLTISTNGVPIWRSFSSEPGPGPWPTTVKRFALFIIPLNDTASTDGVNHYTQFELKASTNNFSAAASGTARCCFYSHSGHADGFYSTNDRMHLFLNHGGVDQRSYVRIPNTLEGMPNYAPSEVIVLVDATLMNPDRSDGAWLYENNESIVWTWVRTKNGARELDPGTEHCLWRPIAPVRWFAALPAWAN